MPEMATCWRVFRSIHGAIKRSPDVYPDHVVKEETDLPALMCTEVGHQKTPSFIHLTEREVWVNANDMGHVCVCVCVCVAMASSKGGRLADRVYQDSPGAPPRLSTCLLRLKD